MLVLTRKIGEQIKIGDSITLTVVDIDGKKTRIGIEAPREVVIARQEVYVPPTAPPVEATLDQRD